MTPCEFPLLCFPLCCAGGGPASDVCMRIRRGLHNGRANVHPSRSMGADPALQRMRCRGEIIGNQARVFEEISKLLEGIQRDSVTSRPGLHQAPRTSLAPPMFVQIALPPRFHLKAWMSQSARGCTCRARRRSG
jgi:hypothetical protein